jgi:hypothetical protein
VAGLTIADKAAIWSRARIDYEFFAKHFLKIRTNRRRGNSALATEGLDPFVHNALQRKINATLFAQSQAGMEERLLILKSRQEGCSTDIVGLGFWRDCFNDYFEFVVTAHLKESAAKLSGIAQTFNDGLPAFAAPRIGGKSRYGGLTWKNKSTLRIETARSDEAARSARPSMRLLSEMSFYDAQREKTSAASMMQATLSGMDEVAGTTVVGETTSRGPAGEFYDRFLMAQSGESSWAWLFFSWKDSDKYRPGAGIIADLTPEDVELDERMRAHWARGEVAEARALGTQLGIKKDVWFQRALKEGLSPVHVRWAQKTQADKFKGDIVAFDREYPLTWQIAFAAGGRTVLAREYLDAWRERSLPEATIVGTSLEPGRSGFELDPHGEPYWQIYTPPQSGHEYVIGVDAAAGRGTDEASDSRAQGDYAAIQVFDRHTKTQVAEFYSKVTEPGPLGIQALRAAVLYNGAFVVVERNNHGGTTIDRLVEHGYRHLYRESNTTRAPRAGPRMNESIGFWTDLTSRTPLFDAWADAVREGNYIPISKRLAGECETFVYDQWDRPDHMKGRKSDAITASALCWHGHRSLPAPRPVVETVHEVQSELEQALAEWRRQARAPRPKRAGRYGGYMGGVT